MRDLIERARAAQHSILPQPDIIKELADEVERLRGALEAAPTREEIAKIIDPSARFNDIEGIIWSKYEVQRRELAYQKADAILALKAT